ncbi:MAG TPA: hypothetical protein H9959_10430 [Candidatus Mediterraneibacter ornithocaccae]|nr:hypothetical protein [Candidatus Mediterraneibacter ornithocaccae]
MTARRELLKRLERVERRCIPKDVECMVFIEESNEKGVYIVTEIIYTVGQPGQRKKTEKIKAASAQVISDNYKPPEGCKSVIVFMYDYGSEES